MGLFDFISGAQEKLNNLQKRIETFSPNDLFMKQGKSQKSEKQKTSKQCRSKSSRPVISAVDQIRAQRDSMIRNGFSEYEFIANRGCCSVCAELNGEHFPVSKLQIGVNAPPMHEGCHCSIAAWSDRKEYEEWLNRF